MVFYLNRPCQLLPSVQFEGPWHCSSLSRNAETSLKYFFFVKYLKDFLGGGVPIKRVPDYEKKSGIFSSGNTLDVRKRCNWCNDPPLIIWLPETRTIEISDKKR